MRDQLDEAWNEAMNEIAEGSGESISEELEGGDIAPGSGGGDLAPVSATRGGETIQKETAPGGDWFNTVINLHENPVMDRYLRRMKEKREGRSRVSRKIEVEAEIANAVDQCLDHFAGDMLPSEISSEHVQQFIKDRQSADDKSTKNKQSADDESIDVDWNSVDWEKVYEAIQKISDPRKRHEEDPKERTNQEASRRRKAAWSYEQFSGKSNGNGQSNGHHPGDLEISKANEWFNKYGRNLFSKLEGLVREAEDAEAYFLEEDIAGALETLEGFHHDLDKLLNTIGKSGLLGKEVVPSGLGMSLHELYPRLGIVKFHTSKAEKILRETWTGNVEAMSPEGLEEVGQILESLTSYLNRLADDLRSEGPKANRKSGLKSYREICACCKGTGEKGERCCGQCGGSGQTDVSAFDEDLDQKEKIAARLGSLTLVSVDVGNRGVSGEDRRELARLTGSRVASKGAPRVFRHSTRLMKILVESGIPYRTASYRHPRYRR